MLYFLYVLNSLGVIFTEGDNNNNNNNNNKYVNK